MMITNIKEHFVNIYYVKHFTYIIYSSKPSSEKYFIPIL